MDINPNIQFTTPYQDVNEILYRISHDLKGIFRGKLIGLYLFGSLTYGDFKYDRSDIDLLAILQGSPTPTELGQLKTLHKEIEGACPKWAERLEGSYVPLSMLVNILPPQDPRPYYGAGTFYEEALYGNEWIINNYLLYHSGVALIGPNFKELIEPIDIFEVQKACVRDLFKEWKPKLNDPEWLNNSHYQSYLILTLCRILYTVMGGRVGSKTVSAGWVKKELAPQWKSLIETAQDWQYGRTMLLREETREFMRFVIEKITQTELYRLNSFSAIISP